MTSPKRFKTWRDYLPKGSIDNSNVIIHGKNFYDQPIDSDIKLYEDIKGNWQRDKAKSILLDVC